MKLKKVRIIGIVIGLILGWILGALYTGNWIPFTHGQEPVVIEGYAAHYRPDVMEQVSANRNMPIVDCMIATAYADLGDWVIVTSHVTGATLTCRVTDIPQDYDRQSIIERGIVVEFGWANTPMMCNLSHYGQEPPSACPVSLQRNLALPITDQVKQRVPIFYWRCPLVM